ncbi:hypothetical protein, partial [uncultured Desulfovibrio sp.]|uniref:hypothetical protein n=1 Tax=uncultured Desulfovibrio sp. TaxID=167968 RepID=UPI00266FB908
VSPASKRDLSSLYGILLLKFPHFKSGAALSLKTASTVIRQGIFILKMPWRQKSTLPLRANKNSIAISA